MIDFRIERGLSFDGYQAWIIDYRHDGQTLIAKPLELEFVKHDKWNMLPEPSLRITGPLGREFLLAARKSLAEFNTWDKESYEVSARIEKAMQAHIDSLKLVVERIVK